MNFLQLKTESRQILWPDLESENLVSSHDRFFNDALWDLNTNVECFRFNQTEIYPHCSTFFNCGMTVIPAPRGTILKVYAIGTQVSTSATATPTDAATASIGTIVGQIVLQQAMLNPPQTNLSVCSITSDGSYAIAVDQQYIVPPEYATPNSPQYLNATINYTDIDGVAQTIQPAPTAHLDGVKQAGVLTVQVKGGTLITCSLVPFNTPKTDGGFTINVVVKQVAAGNATGSSESTDSDWCSKVFYDQVDYCHIEEYVRLSKKCGTPNALFSTALTQGLFGCGWRTKRRFPCPTDEGLESLPKLPQGFRYPQSSTDVGGRSRGGVWAIYRGRIYVAPWIESTETLIVEWNGIKNQWSDADEVEDSAKFRQAVRNYVNWQHFLNFEENQQKMIDLKTSYDSDLRDLIHECREQTRVRTCNEAMGNGSGARGMGTTSIATASFFNEAQTFTAICPAGQAGSPVTVTIPAGQVGSSLSVADANATALSMATSQAQAGLSCSASQLSFLNIAQTYTASCPGASGTTPAATGNSVTVTIPAGQFSSSVSQAAADAAALAAATAQANSQLVCTFHNGPKSFTASCPVDTTGSDVTVAVAAGTYSSIVSQSDADAQALAAAQNQAVAGLTCTGVTSTIGNTQQTFTINRTLTCNNGAKKTQSFLYTAVVHANTYTKVTTPSQQAADQLALNQQAQAAAQANCNAAYAAAQAAFQSNCRQNPTG